jgi:hypothetical protein
MIDVAYIRLNERAKELKCIYNVEELLKKEDYSLETIFNRLLEIIPPAWQYATVCEVRIIYENKVYMTSDFRETEWFQKSDIVIDNNIVGEIQVYYTQFIKLVNNCQFLAEEQKLLNTIAERLSNYIFYQKLQQTLEYFKSSEKDMIPKDSNALLSLKYDEHWKWRLKIAQKIVYKLDYTRFGIANIYLIGSTKNELAGPASDIDFLVHFKGNEQQKQNLVSWFEGCGLCLSEMNYLKTGYETDNLIDLHIITDEDIKNNTSFAVMINSLDNRARLLR